MHTCKKKEIPEHSGKLISPSLHFEHFSPVIKFVLQVHCPLESQLVDCEPVILHRQSEKNNRNAQYTLYGNFQEKIFVEIFGKNT